MRPRSLDTNRAKSSAPEKVDTYYKNLDDILEKYDLRDKPQFIYNIDETGIQPEHRPPNVIAPVGSKPQAITSPRSTTTTVIGCANATGNSVPPFFIFKGKRYNPDLMKGATPGAHAVMSDSGWSNADIFQEYLKTQFIPNVRGGCADDQKILLICDGHTSHVSKSVIEWANSKNVILFILPAHTSHLLQPLDVSIFSPFKTYYYSECATYMRNKIGQTVTRYQMCQLACTAYMKAMTPQNIVAGFRKTGIYPIAKDIVPKEKLFPSESFTDSTPVEKVTAIKAGKEALERYLLLKAERKMNCCCDCHETPQSSNKTPSTSNSKPNPGGKAITEEEFVNAVEAHEKDKENAPPSKKNVKKTTKRQPSALSKCSQPKKPRVSSQKPSTSGLHTNRVDNNDSDTDLSDTEHAYDESQDCCVCKQFSPPNLNLRPYLKLVSWADCDRCGHWVHLGFCTKQYVVRLNDTFYCPHCQD